MNARALGVKVIGVTSVAYATRDRRPGTSRAPSSRTTATSSWTRKIAVGDAELTHDAVPAPFAPASTVVTSALMQAVMATAAGDLAERGIEPAAAALGQRGRRPRVERRGS